MKNNSAKMKNVAKQLDDIHKAKLFNLSKKDVEVKDLFIDDE
ncbi:11126_t:CDS:2 [Funneliformis mosseae]|uniref:11126_t:CDS:1 n=1 Tax=Funneliformis mosseae TaxID=27381 RepID=A0A9N9AA67_FUNMO|nr:11126_t:CDS:2 [Funneliformis mosseae]